MKKILITLSLIVLAGCTNLTPPYNATIANAQMLKGKDVKEVSVGEFETPEKLNRISLRANTLKSSVGDSFGDYLSVALTDELKMAKVWSGISDVVVSGKLVENDVDISGFSTGEGIIKVNFVVTKANQVIYEKEITGTHEFESSFMGSIAITNGQLSYLELTQNLIHILFSDSEFVKAIN